MSTSKSTRKEGKGSGDAGDEGGLQEKAAAYIKSSITAAGQTLSKGSNASSDLKKNVSEAFKTATNNVGKRGPDLPRIKIWHYDLYVTDGYINISSGAWPPKGDNTVVPGWREPIYIWGFTDADPNISGNLMTVPVGAAAQADGPVGNAKFPGPFLEAGVGEDVFITVHNRGFFQKLQSVQDDQALHLHGICCQAPYDGFPESAGGYGENLRYFWEEDWYREHGKDTKERDRWWNSLSADRQQEFLRHTPLIKPNQLNQNGCVYSFRNAEAYPEGAGGTLPYGTKEDWTQFTYHFRPERAGTFIYCSQSVAPEHMQMGMYGALVVRPADYTPEKSTVYGRDTGTDYDQEYTFLLSEFDPRWHRFVEGDRAVAEFDLADSKPQLWFINGRSFPLTLLPFAWNRQGGNAEPEERYNTHIKVAPQKRFLVRYINAGSEAHPMKQHGWPMIIVGSDGFAWRQPLEKSAILIGPGESYDAITDVNVTYGVNAQAGSPLASVAPAPVGPGTLKWRQIYPIRNQDDCRVSTRGVYPGGMMTVIEATGASNTPSGKPTWFNPYSDKVEIAP